MKLSNKFKDDKQGLFLTSIISAALLVILLAAFFIAENKSVIHILFILPFLIFPFLRLKNTKLFEPVLIISGLYMLYFVIAPLYGVFVSGTSKYGIDVRDYIFKGNIVLIVGFVAFLIGYYLNFNTDKESLEDSIRVEYDYNQVLLSIFIIINLILLTIYFYVIDVNWLSMISFGFFGKKTILNLREVSSLANYLSLSLNGLIPLLLIKIFTCKKKSFFIVLYLLILLVSAYIGSRYRILIIVIAPIVLYYLSKKTMPKIWNIVILAVVSFLIVGFIGNLRTDLKQEERDGSYMYSMTEIVDSFMGNLSIYKTHYILTEKYNKSIKPYYGKTYLQAFYAPIPRSWWEEKPDPFIWEIIVDLMETEQARIQGWSYLNIDEVILNFGFVGLAIYMLLWGLLMKFIWKKTYKSNNVMWLVFYSIMWPYLIQYISRGYFVQILIESVSFFLPIVIVGLFTKKRLIEENNENTDIG